MHSLILLLRLLLQDSHNLTNGVGIEPSDGSHKGTDLMTLLLDFKMVTRNRISCTYIHIHIHTHTYIYTHTHTCTNPLIHIYKVIELENGLQGQGGHRESSSGAGSRPASAEEVPKGI